MHPQVLSPAGFPACRGGGQPQRAITLKIPPSSSGPGAARRRVMTSMRSCACFLLLWTYCATATLLWDRTVEQGMSTSAACMASKDAKCRGALFIDRNPLVVNSGSFCQGSTNHRVH